MNKTTKSALSLFLILCLLGAAAEVEACTNLIVGKNASADGSVMCTWNNDGYAFSGAIYHHPGGRHEKGEMHAVHWWDSGVKGYIPEVEYTYSVMGWINEKQVAIGETTFDGRTELVNPEGLFDYATLMVTTLQRAATAREAITVMTDLANEWGYCSSGESMTVCDKNEAWILEIIGKGPGVKGVVWVARRIPDDCICAHANLSRIRKFPLKDKENCLYAKDVISFAREKGYFSGRDEDFSFRDAYCPIDFENVRYGDARVYSFFRHHTDKAEMDKYLPYLNGDFSEYDELPLWIRPDQPLTERDLMNDMRDHFEGTPLDMTADVGAGPWGMPVRPRPMRWKVDDKTYFNERPIAVPQSGHTLVFRLRSWLPDVVGGIMYYNLDDSNMIAYTPVYCGATDVPACFRRENNDYGNLNFDGAFWTCNFVSNMVYPRYSAILPDLRQAQKEVEDRFQHDIDSLGPAIKDFSHLDMIEAVNRASRQASQQMMTRWHDLAKHIIMKHNDLYQDPYEQRFRQDVVKATGDRYLMRQVIERRER